MVTLVLPFAPVTAEQTTVTWPVPGRPVVSSTALFAPYRPATPEVDWGALYLSGDTTARDTYQRTTTTASEPRHGDISGGG